MVMLFAAETTFVLGRNASLSKEHQGHRLVATAALFWDFRYLNLENGVLCYRRTVRTAFQPED